ncbi:P-loop containing nucleoside triphosphate hydrolase protein [Coniophora puteana RWD-64-598 SS2]|uniref:DNA 3'-5' helicase n=1 Tax=Coniophora puteana (strain RWD-64-598) TaxID=741705 RepID=A0A5M3M9M6_CONPW|nr:P-loop containing nucleoside triphosphate hydrolase protein [Coniophora puteana RWD-64-598 SS2]EIW75948.1 P-loop containing nucleoside triphosphate hydrolase protein [Coniophora puteana RWD-64-598 SS2]
MNEKQPFIIEDLDDYHLIIKADEEYRVRRELEAEAKTVLPIGVTFQRIDIPCHAKSSLYALQINALRSKRKVLCVRLPFADSRWKPPSPNHVNNTRVALRVPLFKSNLCKAALVMMPPDATSTKRDVPELLASAATTDFSVFGFTISFRYRCWVAWLTKARTYSGHTYFPRFHQKRCQSVEDNSASRGGDALKLGEDFTKSPSGAQSAQFQPSQPTRFVFLCIYKHILMNTTHTPLPSTIDHHNTQHILSLRRSQTPGYSSEDIRKQFSDKCKERTGFTPHPWQLDCAEAFYLGLDCTVIAGTGSGKTLCFAMPAMLRTDKITLVLSPLNILEDDQARRFEHMGLRATVVNGETFTPKLRHILEKPVPEFQVVFTSPEMVLSPGPFNSMLTSATFQEHLAGAVVDEAHCIEEWGPEFRPAYDELGAIRSIIPLHLPVYATSATMPPHVLATVRSVLHINPRRSYHVNLGNDRPNITQEIRTIDGSKDYAALDYLFTGCQQPEDLPHAIIFVNRRKDAEEIFDRLIKSPWFPVHLHDSVDFLTAKRGKQTKKRVMERFAKGEIRVLISTSAGSMGVDIPDITLVIQFGVPSSLMEWLQRAGRAGRSCAIQAVAILFVEKSVLAKQKVKSRRRENDMSDGEEQQVYRKKVEPALRQWIETTGCRRDVADEYFDNPSGRLSPTGDCCDNCRSRAIHEQRAVMPGSINDMLMGSETENPQDATAANALDGGNSDSSDEDGENDEDNSEGDDVEDEPGQKPNSHGKRPTSSHPAIRRTRDRLRIVRDGLRSWRVAMRRRDYPGCSMPGEALLPDKPLKKISGDRQLTTLEDLHGAVGSAWAFVEEYGLELLAEVQRLDQVADEATQRRPKASASKPRSKKPRRTHEDEIENFQSATPGTSCFSIATTGGFVTPIQVAQTSQQSSFNVHFYVPPHTQAPSVIRSQPLSPSKRQSTSK